MLVHLRIANIGSQTIKLVGFGKDRPELFNELFNEPRSLPFREQRLRKLARGAPIFEEPAGPRDVELLPNAYQDLLLVFAPPPLAAGVLQLEVPSSAWGRKGSCKFRIAAWSEPVNPDGKRGAP